MNTLPAILSVVFLVLDLIVWILVAQAILSWLLAFNVISFRNQAVRQIAYSFDRLTAPLLAPIRRVLPDMGGLDVSPMVLILGIIAIQRILPALLADAGAL